MILYHITKEEYLPLILTEGLKINSGKIGFCRSEAHKRYISKYGCQPIFLTDDIEFISKTMLTNDWVNRNKAIVLHIDFEFNEKYLKKINMVEFVYLSNIPSKHIEILEVNFNKFNLYY